MVTISVVLLFSMADTTDTQHEIPVTPPVGSEPEVEAPGTDEEAETLADAQLSDDARRLRWQSRRPRILHLKEGVAKVLGEPDERGFRALELVPLFDVGDRIVVDCCTKLLRPWTNQHGETVYPWLQTIVGKVRSIDDEAGVVSLFDEESDPRNPAVRWVSFRDGLHDFRLAPAKGNPFAAAAVKPVKPPPAPGEVRRGRGRPKGSKNRPKEVILAEREAYKKLKEERKKGKR